MLPRFKGTASGGRRDAMSQLVHVERQGYFGALTQHVTDGGLPALHRIGNEASRNQWGGDGIPPPPPPTDKERAKGLVMAPVPYDVPRLSAAVPGLREAAGTLARLYRRMGVIGGGGGALCTLTIDHVLHAVVGTPTTDGASSPGRTLTTVRQPLMAFCEVLYADVLLPQLDTVCVARDEWQFVNEKVCGIVHQARASPCFTALPALYAVVRLTCYPPRLWPRVPQIASLAKFYHSCEPQLHKITLTLIEIAETLRQCQVEQACTFHLSHPDYAKTVKKQLKSELVEHMIEVLWTLATGELHASPRTYLRHGPSDVDPFDKMQMFAIRYDRANLQIQIAP